VLTHNDGDDNSGVWWSRQDGVRVAHGATTGTLLVLWERTPMAPTPSCSRRMPTPTATMPTSLRSTSEGPNDLLITW